jgi:hypothetical protein
VTAAGWKLGEMQDQNEGHEDGQGENGTKNEAGVRVVAGWEMFVGFVHCAAI